MADMKSEFEKKEEAAQKELKLARVHLEKVQQRLTIVDECLEYKFTARHYAGGNPEFIKQFYLWLARVEAIGFKSINLATRKYRKSFRNQDPQQMWDGIDPTGVIASLRVSLKSARGILMKQEAAITGRLPGLKARAHRLKVDRLTLEYGKASVDLTNINIKVAIWVPVGILFLALIGIVFFEAAKPEIIEWIRQHVLHLPMR